MFFTVFRLLGIKAPTEVPLQWTERRLSADAVYTACAVGGVNPPEKDWSLGIILKNPKSGWKKM